MIPHPDVNTFFHGFGPHLSRKIINRMVDKALYKKTEVTDQRVHDFFQIESNQPRCYAPDVDPTKTKLAWGPFALPKLKRELGSHDTLIVRQAVTTLADLVYDPVKIVEAKKHHIPTKLAMLLQSNDPYIRERVTMTFKTMAQHAVGLELILQNRTIIANLSSCFKDQLAAVRFQAALAVEMLVLDCEAAQQLSVCGFVESINSRLCSELKYILVVHLRILNELLHQSIKRQCVDLGMLANLTALLKRQSEDVLCGALACLALLCQDPCARDLAIEADLLNTLKTLVLEDDRVSVNTEAALCACLVSIATKGKLRLLQLEMTSPLVQLALNKCRYCRNPRLLLAIIKLLTNVSEAPEGRRLLLEKHYCDIVGIEVGNELVEQHRQILLDTINWEP
ncbi:hypothetical protein TKK_0014991 [Trichogramma kaykai]|uniref:Armadillo repeat-containing domain-containing protein n=1 Tax=Trichogramma kaykai TaxID=54128 RepID=A0ABD2WCZ8_9HYME